MDKQDKQPEITGTYSQLYEIAEKKRKEKEKASKPAPKEEKMAVSPTPKKEERPKPKPKKVEKKERQLNAWISASQNEMLDKLYFRLRARGVRIKKGELVGVALEILSRILENKEPRIIDSSALDHYVESQLKKQP
jgi:hypothetical protein